MMSRPSVNASLVVVPSISSAGAPSSVGANVATAVVALLIVNWQAPVPVHGPSQPVNWLPAEADAVRMIGVPLAKGSVHVTPQLMMPELAGTVPGALSAPG